VRLLRAGCARAIAKAPYVDGPRLQGG
jgi:hypothetical protein